MNDPLEELLDGEDSEESDDEEGNNVHQNEEEPDQEHTANGGIFYNCWLKLENALSRRTTEML